ncbi:unnamed protein product [Brachionus calyciflorus]|uniref:Uncharacterized protein n=1 Tax=Brachionus calyciflorus TaxID=104777 RepID=A0A813YXQ1_9BILA|nr:unnamed protein product [Brachionus calyciflorus]
MKKHKNDKIEKKSSSSSSLSDSSKSFTFSSDSNHSTYSEASQKSSTFFESNSDTLLRKNSCCKCFFFFVSIILLKILLLSIILYILEASSAQELDETIYEIRDATHFKSLLSSCKNSNKNIFAIIKKLGRDSECQAVFLNQNHLLTNDLCFNQTFKEYLNDVPISTQSFFIERIHDKSQFKIENRTSFEDYISVVKIKTNQSFDQNNFACFLGSSSEQYIISSEYDRVSKLYHQKNITNIELFKLSSSSQDGYSLDPNDSSQFIFTVINETIFLNSFFSIKDRDSFLNKNIYLPIKNFLSHNIKFDDKNSILGYFLKYLLDIKLSPKDLKPYQSDIAEFLNCPIGDASCDDIKTTQNQKTIFSSKSYFTTKGVNTRAKWTKKRPVFKKTN